MTEKVGQNANDTVISEILEMNPELEGIGSYEYCWANSDATRPGKRGLDEGRIVRDISARGTGSGAGYASEGAGSSSSMAYWGADLSKSTSTTSSTSCVRPRAGSLLGTNCPGYPHHLRRLGIPEAGVTPSRCGCTVQSEVVYHRRTWRSRA